MLHISPVFPNLLAVSAAAASFVSKALHGRPAARQGAGEEDTATVPPTRPAPSQRRAPHPRSWLHVTHAAARLIVLGVPQHVVLGRHGQRGSIVLKRPLPRLRSFQGLAKSAARASFKGLHGLLPCHPEPATLRCLTSCSPSRLAHCTPRTISFNGTIHKGGLKTPCRKVARVSFRTHALGPAWSRPRCARTLR